MDLSDCDKIKEHGEQLHVSVRIEGHLVRRSLRLALLLLAVLVRLLLDDGLEVRRSWL